MIKAVFFDWFNTLARYEPPREALHSQALQEVGIKVSAEKILPSLLVADRYFFDENARSPVEKRPAQKQRELYLHYQQLVLSGSGVTVDQETLLKIMKRVRRLFSGTTFALFEDVLPTLKTLKERKFIIGLLTNLNQDMGPICQKLGIQAYLDFVVTSGEVGADKPSPLIFLTALQRAGVSALEAVHVGDQYKIDVLGARGVGIAPILLDRYNLYSEVSDCPRIQSLAELPAHLK